MISFNKLIMISAFTLVLFNFGAVTTTFKFSSNFLQRLL
jgi:hypothetical protein